MSSMGPPPSKPLRQDDFRKLLTTPRVDAVSEFKRVGKTPAPAREPSEDGDGGAGASSRAAEKERRKARFKPKPKKGSGSDEEEKGPKAQRYRDRAQERREGKSDYAEAEKEMAAISKPAPGALNALIAPSVSVLGRAEDAQKAAIEQSKFLGGDLEHTHLVKGLDYALLEKVRREMEEPRSKAESSLEEGAAVAAPRQLQFISKLGRSVHKALQDSGLVPRAAPEAAAGRGPPAGVPGAVAISTTAQKEESRRSRVLETLVRGGRVEAFLPGRTAYQFDLDPDFPSELPTTVTRSLADTADADELMQAKLDDALAAKLNRVFNNLRAKGDIGAQRARKPKQKKSGGLLRGDEYVQLVNLPAGMQRALAALDNPDAPPAPAPAPPPPSRPSIPAAPVRRERAGTPTAEELADDRTPPASPRADDRTPPASPPPLRADRPPAAAAPAPGPAMGPARPPASMSIYDDDECGRAGAAGRASRAQDLPRGGQVRGGAVGGGGGAGVVRGRGRGGGGRPLEALRHRRVRQGHLRARRAGRRAGGGEGGPRPAAAGRGAAQAAGAGARAAGGRAGREGRQDELGAYDPNVIQRDAKAARGFEEQYSTYVAEEEEDDDSALFANRKARRAAARAAASGGLGADYDDDDDEGGGQAAKGKKGKKGAEEGKKGVKSDKDREQKLSADLYKINAIIERRKKERGEGGGGGGGGGGWAGGEGEAPEPKRARV